MGLDMYLTARRGTWLLDDDRRSDLDKKINNFFPETEGYALDHIVMEVFYWRKANAIHGWFVRNVQEGVDDCNKYYVNEDALKKLLATINSVLSDRSEENVRNVLKPTSGFFFGSTEINERFFETMESTKVMLEKLLSNEKFLRHWDIYYQSSW